MHAAYDYLLREFGLEVTAVVEPAHGIEPSPSQLKKTIDELRALDVKVIFSEMDFPSTYVDTIQRESGVKLYPLSHISYGEYSAEKYEVEMTGNLNTVVRAIQEVGRMTAARIPEGRQRRPDARVRHSVPDPGPHRDPRRRELPGAARQRPRPGRPQRRRQKLADQDPAGTNAASGSLEPAVADQRRAQSAMCPRRWNSTGACR